LYLSIVLFVILVTIAYAAAVSVSTEKLQSLYGELRYVYYETSSTVSTTTPNVNTAMTPPTGTGETEILASSSAYLWSTQFQQQTPVSAGVWVLNFWASGLSAGGSFTISIYVTNSAGTKVSTLVGGASSGALSLSETEVTNAFSASAATIPASGYVEVVLASSVLGAAFLDWGSGQLTDFQLPQSVLT
jgi:hypothetical protein